MDYSRFTTDLNSVCALLMDCSLNDPSHIKMLYAKVYELIKVSYDDTFFQPQLHSRIIQATNTKLVKLFHEHLHAHNIMELDTWITFLRDVMPRFKHFFDTACYPFVIHCQDKYVSPYLKKANHPFRECTAIVTALYQSNEPILREVIHQTVEQYVESAKEYVMHPEQDTVRAKYEHLCHLLRSWFKESTYSQLLFAPASYLQESFVCCVSATFGSHTFHDCLSFYRFMRQLYDVSFQHLLILQMKPTTERKKRIAMDICDRYRIDMHWLATKNMLREGIPFPPPLMNTDIHTMFYWPRLQQAFAEQDIALCKSYLQAMVDATSELFQCKFFNSHYRQSLFTSYAIDGVRKQENKNADTLCQYYTFINDVVTGSTPRSYQTNLMFMLGTVMYEHMFRGMSEDSQHTYLKDLCLQGRTVENVWEWFVILWSHAPNKDAFLLKYIETHLRPAIVKKTLNITDEDTFYLMCARKFKDECPSQMHTFRSLLNEWHHRSMNRHSFVVNRSLWPTTPTVDVRIHPEIQALLSTQTKTYQESFAHRQVRWCHQTTQLTLVFESATDPMQSIRVCGSLFATNLLLWIHESPGITVGQWVNTVLEEKEVNRNNLLAVYKHLDHFLKHRVVHASDCLSPLQPPEHNDAVCIQLAYGSQSDVHTLTPLSSCFKAMAPPKRTPSSAHKTLLLDRKSVVEATMLRTLKHQSGTLVTSTLFDVVAKAITSFSVDRTDFDIILASLHNRDYVSVDEQRNVSYVP